MSSTVDAGQRVTDAQAELDAALAELRAEQDALRAQAPANPTTYSERRRAGVYEQMAAQRAAELAAELAAMPAPLVAPDPREHVPLGGDVELAEYIDEVAGDGGAGGGSTVADTTLSASAATITFSGLDLSAVHQLTIVMSLRTVGSGEGGLFDHPYIRFNGDGGANYAWAVENSNVTEAHSASDAAMLAGHAQSNNAAAGEFGQTIGRIPFPGSSTSRKTFVYDGSLDDGSYLHTYGIGYWKNTAPITAITVMLISGDVFAAGSRVALLAA